MKAKLKSANGPTRFLLAHGEKLGMAAVLTVAFLLIWKSLGRERLESTKQPTQLASKADAATGHYEGMKWSDFPKEERVDAEVFLATASDGVMTPVSVKDFPNIAAINPRVTDPIGLRSDPTLLAPEKLEVNSGSGLWAWSDPEVQKKMALRMLQEQQAAQKDAEEEARLAEEEMENGGRGRSRGREGFGGERGMRGMMSGAMGGLEMTEDGVPVVRPANAMGAQGFEDIRDMSWVTVLAKVPIKEQVAEYEEALATARGYDPTSDMPTYIGYQVQRAEMTEDGLSDWVNLPSVLKTTIIDAMERRPFEFPELASEKYTHPLLTWPLPSMVLRSWGDDVTHSDLPIPTPEDLMEEMQGEQPRQPKDQPGEEGADEFTKQIKGEEATLQPGGGYGGYGAEGGRFPMPGGYGGMEGGRGMPMGIGGPRGMGMSMGGEMGRGMGMGMMMGQGAGAYNNLPDKPWDGKTKYILFRYFDSTVKPGLRYRYRVRLVLNDVNNKVPEKYLDPTVVSRQKEEKKKGYRVTDWSEPSPTAAVPLSGLVYVAQAEAAKGFNEPVAKLIVKSLDAANVAEVAVADEFTRGSVINLAKRQPSIIWSPSFQTQDRDGEPVKAPEFDIVTGLTLLDFNGGEELNKSRDNLAPSRALVMDATGRMSIERELDVLKKIREFDMIEAASKEALRAQEEQGGGEQRRGGRGSGRGGGGRGGF